MAFTHGIKIMDAASNADVYSKAVDCRGRYNVRFQFSGLTTTTPVGVFKVYATEDPRVIDDIAAGIHGPAATGATAEWFQVTLPAGSVHIDPASSGTTVTLPDDEIAWDGTAAAKFAINLDSPFGHMCVMWDRTSGGSASASRITVWCGARE